MNVADALKKTWITIREGSEIIGVSVQRMHQLIEEYDLETDSINPRLKVMKRSDADKLKDMDRPDGVRRDRRQTPA